MHVSLFLSSGGEGDACGPLEREYTTTVALGAVGSIVWRGYGETVPLRLDIVLGSVESGPIMAKRDSDRQLEADLMTILQPCFAGITVSVGHSERWDRTSATFRWPGFADLLPEERFHRLIRVIPEDVRRTRMGGVVWVELAGDETIDQYLKLPRSEDLGAKERDIFARLNRVGFFAALAALLGPTPEARCEGDFSRSVTVLSRKNVSDEHVRQAKLLFIRHGVYCDCQVLPLAKHAPADKRAEVL